MHKNSGFTLIELSIVLVIIALIVGGVLVGRDLIAAAQVRSVIAEMDSYSTAVNAFRTKYNAFPGDLNTAQATQFGLAPASRPGNIAEIPLMQHGDFSIGICDGVDEYMGTEGSLFWRDLSSANFMTAQFSTATDAIATGATDADLPLHYPISKIKTAMWLVTSARCGTPGAVGVDGSSVINDGTMTNYFFLGKVGTTSGGGGDGKLFSDNSDTYGGLNPVEAYNIDKKIDNGEAKTGKVVANISMTAGTPLIDSGGYASSQATPNCAAIAGYGGITTTKYNLDTYPNNRVCNLNIRM